MNTTAGHMAIRRVLTIAQTITLTIGLTIVGSVASCLTRHSALQASDWPLARGNAMSTGASADEVPAQPDLLWEVPFGGMGFEGTPIVVDQTVYLGDVDGRFLALSLADGKTVWEKKFSAGFLAPAAYHDGKVYIGDYEGTLHAMSAKDGAPLWTFKTTAQIDAGASFFGSNVLITSEDGILYCLKESDGQLVWKYETGDQLRCGATLAENNTFLGGCDGKLHIVDLTKGTSAHEPAPLEAPTGSTPAVSGDTVVVPTHAGDLFGLKAKDGTQIWKVHNPKLAQEFQNSVAIADGLAVASSHNRRVFAVDMKDGSIRWETVIRKRCDSSPVIAKDKVVLAATDGRVILLDLATGKELWVYEVKGVFLASPAVASNRIIVASDKGTVYCFGKRP